VYTIETLHDDHKLLDWVYNIYDMTTFEAVDGLLLLRMLNDDRIRLGQRITKMLRDSTGILSRHEREKALDTCLRAIFRLVSMKVHRTPTQRMHKIWFGMETLRALAALLPSETIMETSVQVFSAVVREFTDLARLLQNHLSELSRLAQDHNDGMEKAASAARDILKDKELMDRVGDMIKELEIGQDIMKFHPEALRPTKMVPWICIAEQMRAIWPLYDDFLATARLALSYASSPYVPQRTHIAKKIHEATNKGRQVLRVLYSARGLVRRNCKQVSKGRQIRFIIDEEEQMAVQNAPNNAAVQWKNKWKPMALVLEKHFLAQPELLEIAIGCIDLHSETSSATAPPEENVGSRGGNDGGQIISSPGQSSEWLPLKQFLSEAKDPAKRRTSSEFVPITEFGNRRQTTESAKRRKSSEFVPITEFGNRRQVSR